MEELEPGSVFLPDDPVYFARGSCVGTSPMPK